MASVLPGGALGDVVYQSVVDSYDESTAKKDPGFYSADHTELRNAFVALREDGKQLTLSRRARERLEVEVAEATRHDVKAVREQARKWQRENGMR